MTRPEYEDDKALAAWANEHLIYEIDTLVFALEKLDGKPLGMEANLALESFAVHARNLLDFLWGKPNPRFDNNSFASDFSEEWNGRRGPVPPHLADADDRNRFGKEVFHLTFDRISGIDKRKVWPCGEIAIEIAGALALFAKLARPTALNDETRARLAAVSIQGDDEEGQRVDRILRLGGASHIGGATPMDPSQFRHGTINPRNLDAGGT